MLKNILEDLFVVLLMLPFFLFYAVPGMIVARIGWRLSRKMTNISAQTLIRAGLVSVAFAPTLFGHIGMVPAIWLVGRREGIVPFLIVWLFAIPAIRARSRKRAEPPRGIAEAP